MTTTTRLRSLAVLAGVLFALTAGTALAATITIVNNDGAGEGFNDLTPRAPVGGNPASTSSAIRARSTASFAAKCGSARATPLIACCSIARVSG